VHLLQPVSHFWHERPVATEPPPKYLLGQALTQSALWRNGAIEAEHTKHVFSSEHFLQLASHLLQTADGPEPLPKYPDGHMTHLPWWRNLELVHCVHVAPAPVHKLQSLVHGLHEPGLSSDALWLKNPLGQTYKHSPLWKYVPAEHSSLNATDTTLALPANDHLEVGLILLKDCWWTCLSVPVPYMVSPSIVMDDIGPAPIAVHKPLGMSFKSCL
jgi:hypothetical protein